MIIINNINQAQSATTPITLTGRVSSADEVIVILIGDDSSTIPGFVKFNGTNVPLVVSALQGVVESAAIAIVWNPPVGAYTVLIDDQNTGGLAVTVMSLLGVSKRTTNVITATSTAGANAATLAVPIQIASANSMVLDVIAINDAATTFPFAALPQKQFYNIADSVGANIAMSYMYAQPGVQTTNWAIQATGSPLAYCAIVLEPAQAPSIWFPNLGLRSVDDAAGPAVLIQGGANHQTALRGSYNFKENNYYKNSFLHTVGRMLNPPPSVLPLPPPSSMTSQIVIDKITEMTVNGVTNPSIQHTVTSADVVLLVIVGALTTDPTIQVNGTSIPKIGTVTNVSQIAAISYMVNPPVGSLTITALTANQTVSFAAITLLGVNKSTSQPQVVTAAPAAGAVNTIVNSARAKSLLIDIFSDSNLDVVKPSTAEQTQLFNSPVSGVVAVAASYRTADFGSYTMGWIGGTGNLAQAIVVLEPAHAPSTWFPVIGNRNINDVIRTNALDSSNLSVAGLQYSFGNNPITLWQNSFLHTVGRTAPQPGSTVNASITQVAASITFADGGGNTVAAVNNVSIAQSAATLTFTGGTQVIATVNNVAISQLAATITFAGGTQAVATVNNVAIAQSAATLTFTGGTQTVATIQNVSIAQLAATITFTGGTQTAVGTPVFIPSAVEVEQQTSQIIIDKIYQATSSGGNPLTIDVSIPSPDAVLVVTGGSVISTGGQWQSVSYRGSPGVNLISQVTSGTDAEIWYFPLPTVGVSQLVITPTATFGQAYVNAIVLLGVDKKSVNLQAVAASNSGTIVGTSITPDAPNSLLVSVLSALDTLGEPTPQQNQNQMFAPSGINSNEYVEVAFQLASSTQNITYSLGTLANASLVVVSFRPAQPGSIWFPNIDTRQLNTVVDANGLDSGITPIPGTYGYNAALFYQNSFLQTIGRYSQKAVQSAFITQSAASLTFTGNTQTVATVNNVSITQVAATVTFTGGTQVVASVQNASVTQSAATVTFTGGTQAVATVNNVNISQLGATITFAGGTQVIATINNVSITQSAATITFSGGTQIASTRVTAAVTQVAASLTFTGGTQAVSSFTPPVYTPIFVTLKAQNYSNSLDAELYALEVKGANRNLTLDTPSMVGSVSGSNNTVTLAGTATNITLSGD